jgi:hypothetical protein
MKKKTRLIASLVLVTVITGGALLAWTKPWTAFTTVTVNEASVSDAYLINPPRENSVNEDAPGEIIDVPIQVALGTFQSQNHPTTGSAVIVQLPEAGRVLTLEGFKTDNGPDLRVYLVSDPENARSGYFVDLAALKGNEGTQNYEIPNDADLDQIVAVSIWCEDFSVPFGYAPLAQVG